VQTKETLSKSMSMRFLVLFSVSGFFKVSKILNFNSRFGRHSFSVNSFISTVFFPNASCIFVLTIAAMFARDSRQQYRFMHKCNSTLNIFSSMTNQNAAFTFSYAILCDTPKKSRSEILIIVPL